MWVLTAVFGHGIPRWKMNTNLLYLELMHSELENEIKTYIETNRNCEVSSYMVWDLMKAVRGGGGQGHHHHSFLQQRKAET